MTVQSKTPLLDLVNTPSDLRKLEEAQLRQLADELRRETIDAVSVTGGHLGAGLGVVELTVALHYVFDTPNDRLIWDVGHQAYPHKILTGRRDRMRTLRQGGGLSGFTKRAESEYDPFGAAHSSTSISAGLGMAVARDLEGEKNNVIAVIGDGAMSAGMAYEAMNNAGAMNSRLIVILNDNDMSIAPPVGAHERLSGAAASPAGLSRLAPLDAADRQAPAEPHAREARDATRNMRAASSWAARCSRSSASIYVGPIDGHNLDHLIPVLENVRDAGNGPILVHVVTQKGKGYAPAEASADKYHGVVKFNVLTGEQKKGDAKAPTYTKVFARSADRGSAKGPKIVAITAAMPSGTGLDLFAKEFPERCFDVGIAEQHGVTFAAGLAAEGLKPFATIYSTFLQRAYDQVVHDVAIQSLPVRFAMDRAGLVGADGPTHAGSFDIAYLGCLPNFVLMAAADEVELMHMVATAVADRRPAVRVPLSARRRPRRGAAGGRRAARDRQGPHHARRHLDRDPLSFGTRLAECLMAAEKLSAHGLSTTVADARFAKPLDDDLIRRLAREHEVLVTIEEGSIGGFGSHRDAVPRLGGLLDHGLKVRPMMLPDRFIDHDTPKKMYEGRTRRERHCRQGVRGARPELARRCGEAGQVTGRCLFLRTCRHGRAVPAIHVFGPFQVRRGCPRKAAHDAEYCADP